jgi:hypothetical protein
MRKLIATILALGLMAIAAPAARAVDGGPFAIQYNVCSPITPVSANGVFNIDVTCPFPGQTVLTGGYSCSCNRGADLLPVIVDVNTFFGFPTPNGWQTIGRTLESAVGHTFACVNNSSGEVKIVASCAVGTNASPCQNNDTCTDLSGQSGQSACSDPSSNPTCQVCISCIGSPA